MQFKSGSEAFSVLLTSSLQWKGNQSQRFTDNLRQGDITFFECEAAESHRTVRTALISSTPCEMERKELQVSITSLSTP